MAWVPRSLHLGLIFFLLHALTAYSNVVQSMSPSDCTTDTSQGDVVRIDCPFSSLMLEYCYLCYYSPQEEMMVCDGWTEDQIRKQCQEPVPIWVSPGVIGNCQIQDISAPFDAQNGWECPMQSSVLPIKIVDNTAAAVTIEALQMFNTTADLGYFAVDCIDPAHPGGDAAGGMPPTCEGCCNNSQTVPPGPVNGTRRQCQCTEGFATVAVYIHDPQINSTFAPQPPIPSHCNPPTANSTGSCRFVYKVPCGCEPEVFDLGDAKQMLLKPVTTITHEPDGTMRVRQSLDTSFTPSDPAAGPATYTRLVTDVKIDESRFGMVDLSQHLDSTDAISCGSTDQFDLIGIDVEPANPLVFLLEPSNHDAPELILSGPPTWECAGQPIFRSVIAAVYQYDQGRLLVATEKMFWEDVIKEGEVTLASNDLQADLLASGEPEPKPNATNATNATQDLLSQFHRLTRQGRREKGQSRRGKFATQNWLNDAAKDFKDWAKDSGVVDALQPLQDTVNGAVKGAGKAVKLALEGGVDINTRLVSLDITLEKEMTYGDSQSENERHTRSGPITLDMIARIHISLGLNFVLKITDYKLDALELSFEGQFDLTAESFALAGGMYTYEWEEEIFVKQMKPIKFMIGSIPVVILPSFPLAIGFESGIEGGIKISALATVGAKLKFGVGYSSDKGLMPIWEFERIWEFEKSVSVSASFYMNPYIKPQVTMNIYGFIEFTVGFQLGPVFTVTALLCEKPDSLGIGRPHATFLVDIDMAFTVDLVFKLGFDLPFLQFFEEWDIYLFNWGKDLYDYSIGPAQLPDVGITLPECEDEAPVPRQSPARLVEFESRQGGVKPGDALIDEAGLPKWIAKSSPRAGEAQLGCSNTPIKKEFVDEDVGCTTYCGGSNWMLSGVPLYAYKQVACECYSFCDLEEPRSTWEGTLKMFTLYHSAAAAAAGRGLGDLVPYPGPDPDGRKFRKYKRNRICSVGGIHRVETVQDTPSHCFAYCEEMRGCGKCPKFSWSAKTLQCIFSMEPRESCDEGYDINFDSYKASGTCPAKDGDAFNRTATIEGFIETSRPGTLLGNATACSEVQLNESGHEMSGAFVSSALPSRAFVLSKSLTWIIAVVDGDRLKMVKLRCEIKHGAGGAAEAYMIAVEAGHTTWTGDLTTADEATIRAEWEKKTAHDGGAVGFGVSKLAVQPAPSAGCQWRPKLSGMMPTGYAGGIKTAFSIADAKQTCVALGAAVCQAITCQVQTCWVKPSQQLYDLSSTFGTHITYLPDDGCYSAPASGCRAWGCTCQGMSDTYGADATLEGAAQYGSAGSVAQWWWDFKDCKTMPTGTCGEWADWGACSKPCGGGVSRRLTNVQSGGLCPRKMQKECNVQVCTCDSNPSDSKHIFPASCDGIEQYQKCDGKCQAGYDGEPWAYCGAEGRWTKFGSCKPACPKIRVTRNALFPASCSAAQGTYCTGRCRDGLVGPSWDPPLAICDELGKWTITDQCQKGADCEGRWSEWTACSQTCGGGKQTRVFIVTQEPIPGGESCPKPQNRKCNAMPCTCPHAITINGLESKFPETTGVFHEVTGTLIEGRKVYKNSADWYLYYYYYAWGTMVMFEHWRIGPSITGPNYHLDALVMSQQTHMVCPTDAQALGMEWKVKVTRKRSSNWEDAGITVTSGVVPDSNCETEWTDWSPCSDPCGGYRNRSLTVITSPQGNGAPCPSSPVYEECAYQPGTADCICVPQKGAKNCDFDLGCLNNGQAYFSLADAFSACQAVPECGFIMENTNTGYFYLRRLMDPDGVSDGGYRLYTCTEHTCTDGKRNGDELMVDCGGSCQACTLDVELAAYMDEASCGPALPNQNSDWCGGAAFTCQNEVSTAKCPATGKATLLRTWGTGSWAAPVYIKGCKYSYYAQWECVGPACDDGLQNGDEHRIDCGGSCPACPVVNNDLNAFWDDGECAAEVNHNNEWCAGAAFQCNKSVEVDAAICPSTRARLLKTEGTGDCCVTVNGCSKYHYHAEYACTAKLQGLEFVGSGWCREANCEKCGNPFDAVASCVNTIDECEAKCQNNDKCTGIGYAPVPDANWQGCRDAGMARCVLYSAKEGKNISIGGNAGYGLDYDCYKAACTLGKTWCSQLLEAGVPEKELRFISNAGPSSNDWYYKGTDTGVGFANANQACTSAKCAGGTTTGTKDAQAALLKTTLSGCSAGPTAQTGMEFPPDCSRSVNAVCYGLCQEGYKISPSTPKAICGDTGDWTVTGGCEVGRHWVIAGKPKTWRAHSSGLLPDYCASDTSTMSPFPANSYGKNGLAVTCCDSPTSTKASRPGCLKNVSYTDAASHCNAEGKVLCSAAQIEAGAGADAGCLFDAYLQWTRDECSGPCSWTPHANTYSLGYAGGVSTSFDLDGAKQKCLELGSSVCKAITCSSSGSCTVRASSSLGSSNNGETTYVASPVCHGGGRPDYDVVASGVHCEEDTPLSSVDSLDACYRLCALALGTGPGICDSFAYDATNQQCYYGSSWSTCHDAVNTASTIYAAPLWKSADSCPRVGVPHPTEWIETSAQRTVVCCSTDGAVCDADPGGSCLPKAATVAEAQAACAAQNMRLCTAAELDSNLCCDTGCDYNTRAVWTSSSIKDEIPIAGGKGACSWTPHANKYSLGYAGGVSTSFDLDGAKQKCLELGSSVCKAITCSGSCTVRASSSLGSSNSGETTYVASPVCYGCNEAMLTSDGTDYRGCQTRTRSGLLCQRWDSQSPHTPTHSPSNAPTAGLVSNYCRNPDGSDSIWCYTTDPATLWEYCDPLPGYMASFGACVSVSESECKEMPGFHSSFTNSKFPRGCYYKVSAKQYYYNEHQQTDCTDDRQCLCRGSAPSFGHKLATNIICAGSLEVGTLTNVEDGALSCALGCIETTGCTHFNWWRDLNYCRFYSSCPADSRAVPGSQPSILYQALWKSAAGGCADGKMTHCKVKSPSAPIIDSATCAQFGFSKNAGAAKYQMISGEHYCSLFYPSGTTCNTHAAGGPLPGFYQAWYGSGDTLPVSGGNGNGEGTCNWRE